MDINLNACQRRYFVSYSGVKLPLNLVNPLAEEERAHRNTCFVGFYDAEDKLMACQKLVYGEIELQHLYQYAPDGRLVAAEITDADGEVTKLDF